MGKCVILHRADGVPMANGICCNVIVVGSTSPLGDSHIAVQISSNLSMVDVPDD